MMTVKLDMSNRTARAVFSLAAFSLLLVLPAAAQKKKPARIAPVSNRYALILADQPVADRFPSRTGFQSAEARAYRTQLETKQEALKTQLRSRNFTVIGAISVLGNDVYVAATPDRVDELKALPGVTGVVQMRVIHQLINRATTLMNAPAAWTTLGGVSKAGAGMKVAIIDSGIDQTHPAFQDSTLTMPSGFPICTTGHSEDCAYATNKVIVARSYVRQIAAGQPATSIPDDYSPRDRGGHGTAVASVVAANTNSAGAVTFNGMAPKAYLGNYKIFNSPGMAYSDASFEDVAVAALNDAFADGFDIVNFSSGVFSLYAPLDTGSACGQTAGTPCDYIAYNFEKAAKNGMVIAVAAGNDGYGSAAGNLPTVSEMSSPATAPSVIAVGGTMNSHVFYPGVSVPGGGSSLAHLAAQTSDGWVSGPFGATAAPMVDASQVGDGYACSALPAYSLYGAFALIERGPATGACSFNVKAANAANAGAIGIVFYDYNTGAIAVQNPITTADASGNIPLFGPVVMVGNGDGLALKSYIDAHAGQAVIIDPNGTEEDISVYNAYAGFSDSTNQLVGYSSPGPNPGSLTGTLANGSFAIKPDMVATSGADPTYIDANQTIYCCSGMYLASGSYDPAGDVYSVNGYVAAEGTSFASPLVAGAAALVWQQHPKYTAAQVKSALVNYTAQDTTSDDYGDNVGVANIGAGRLNAGASVNATVTLSPVSVSFGALSSALPAAQAVQIANSGTSSVTLAITASAPMSSTGTAAAGVNVKLDNASLTIAAGATATLNVSLTGAVPATGQYVGTISLAATGISISVPYLFLVPSTTIYDMFPIVGGQNAYASGDLCFESTPGGDSGPVAIKLVDLSGAPIVGSPVKFSVSPRTSSTLKSVAGEPACASATSGTYTCNTDSYGVAWAEVFASNSPGATSSITATAGGLSAQFGAQDGCGVSVIPVPNITSISDSAVGLTSVAPGSYISIYGSALVNSEFVFGTVGDSATYIPLPLNLDGVNVSFDIPGAYDGTPLDYSGAPGYLTFVATSAGQINLQIPWELQGATSVSVKVMVDGYAASNIYTLQLTQFAPALFQANGIVAAVDATTGQIISASTPAHVGDVVELYGNGLGPVNHQPASGGPAPSNPLASTQTPAIVTIGGQNAAVGYAGLAPGFPGLYQINITVPSGVSTGSQPVVLSIGGVNAKTAQIPIK